jgi:hypothetical protein
MNPDLSICGYGKAVVEKKNIGEYIFTTNFVDGDGVTQFIKETGVDALIRVKATNIYGEIIPYLNALYLTEEDYDKFFDYFIEKGAK